MIHLLDEATVRQIAAGEVIERPASALRELLDNALDAGASTIDIFIEAGGKNLLLVRDNGSGMDKTDLLKAPLLHATSKITRLSDLQHLQTFGFRGEALASLAQVSRLSLASCRGEHGWHYAVHYGKAQPLEPKAMNRGTEVTVEGLFGQLPARLKFLSTDGGESRACAAEFIKKALAHPACAFSFTKNGESLHRLAPAPGLKERIASLFPDAPLQAFSHREEGLLAEGFCSPPSWYRPSRSHQFFFVNGRPTEWAPLRGQISAAYGNFLPPGKFPACFLYLTLPPDFADFNVHPQKKEIRFQKESSVADLVRRALRQGLTSPGPSVSAQPHMDAPPRARANYAEPPFWKPEPARDQPALRPAHGGRGGERAGSYRPEEEARLFERAQNPAAELLQARFAGQIFHTYLVFDRGSEAVFIDFHALHERIRYEKLVAQKNLGLEAQPLLLPLTFTLTRGEADEWQRSSAAMEIFGFGLGRIGETQFAAESLPPFLHPSRAEEVLRDLFALAKEAPDFTDAALWDRACKSIACKGAAKGGELISPAEAEALLIQWQDLGSPPSCPHGRPIAIRRSRADFDKEFKRLGF